MNKNYEIGDKIKRLNEQEKQITDIFKELKIDGDIAFDEGNSHYWKRKLIEVYNHQKQQRKIYYILKTYEADLSTTLQTFTDEKEYGIEKEMSINRFNKNFHFAGRHELGDDNSEFELYTFLDGKDTIKVEFGTRYLK